MANEAAGRKFPERCDLPGRRDSADELLASGPHALDRRLAGARAEDGFGILSWMSTPVELGVDAADSTINQTIALRSNMLTPAADNRAHNLEQFIEERRAAVRRQVRDIVVGTKG